MRIEFLGATGTVTGSKYVVRTRERVVMVDCGLFQGYKQLRLRNWAPLPIDPGEIDVVVLTHAHIDHSGYLPLLVKNGFKGPIVGTRGTCDLCAILLPDSGRLQEEFARFANRGGFSRHKPAQPLYTEDDAVVSLDRFRSHSPEQRVDLGGGVTVTFYRAGHILGASFVLLEAEETRLLFSGDLGRPNDPIMLAPAAPPRTDYLVVESTYGDRIHSPVDAARSLGEVIERTVTRGGTVVVPAFAVGRAQELLYFLAQLRDGGAIPDVPVYLDSPMAQHATSLLEEHPGEHRLSSSDCARLRRMTKFASTPDESKALSRSSAPKIIISASGMATGGRVLHHLKAFAPDERNTILFAGFQAGGTRGASIVGGAEAVKIHGDYVPIRAEVARLENLSAHADSNEILAWLREFPAPPLHTFITHGEPPASEALRRALTEKLGWECSVPEYREKFVTPEPQSH